MSKKLQILTVLLLASFTCLAGPFAHNQLPVTHTSWGVDARTKASINVQGAWKLLSKKKNEVLVAVVDTGIDTSQQELMKNVYVPNTEINHLNFGIDFSKNRRFYSRPSDTNGHGTHVSGIIKSVYPDAKILVLKYYNPQASGQANLNSTIEALRFAVQKNVDIINYSGGGPEPALEELRVLKEAEKKGILVIAAAGNDEHDIDQRKNAYYPASYGLSNIITVAAHDQFIKLHPSSNFGKKSVDISAPGHRIKSTILHGRAGYLTGTSQATAFVSGVAAMIKAQYPKLGFKEIKKIIIDSAIKEKKLATKCRSGGRLDATAALKLAGEKQTINGRKIAGKKKKPGKIIYRMAK